MLAHRCDSRIQDGSNWIYIQSPGSHTQFYSVIAVMKGFVGPLYSGRAYTRDREQGVSS